MDKGFLQKYDRTRKKRRSRVAILIIMDKGFLQEIAKSVELSKVAILIIMDKGFLQEVLVIFNKSITSRNPYYNG